MNPSYFSHSVVSPCSSNPCQNGGTCRISGSTFSCSCPYGHGGTTCSGQNTTYLNWCWTAKCTYIYMSFVWNISGIFAATNTCSRTLTATTNVKQVASRNYPSNYRFVDTLVQLLSQHVASFWNINNSRKRNASSVYTFKNLPDSKSHMMTINLGTAIDVGTR